MAKQFYTERDIEDMDKQGVHSLKLNDDVVLTELAFEKAQKLGLQLLRERPVEPPSAPIRPYLTQGLETNTPPLFQKSDSNLAIRIKDAVNARMGNQVDQQLLDVIIQRVLKNTGVK